MIHDRAQHSTVTMSGETDGGSNKHSHMYGFPGTAGQDRHIQSIIEHAANLFPQSDYQIPRFHPDHGFSRGGDQHEFLNPPSENHDDVRDLDSFGAFPYGFRFCKGSIMDSFKANYRPRSEYLRSASTAESASLQV